jgi:hypothetical protein
VTLRGRISWPRAGLAALATAIALLAFAPPCAADEPADVFARGVLALQKGDFTTAIAELESLADRGFAHPDASFDRGLAYVLPRHARAPSDPGDLGRAAAAFAEASLLRGGDDDEADRAPSIAVRAEVGAAARAHRAKTRCWTCAPRSRSARRGAGVRADMGPTRSSPSSRRSALGGRPSCLLAPHRARASSSAAVLAPTAALALTPLRPASRGARGTCAETTRARRDRGLGEVALSPTTARRDPTVSPSRRARRWRSRERQRRRAMRVRWGSVRGLDRPRAACA